MTPEDRARGLMVGRSTGRPDVDDILREEIESAIREAVAAERDRCERIAATTVPMHYVGRAIARKIREGTP